MDQPGPDPGAAASGSLSPRSRRKQRNRDHMRSARQRERDTMEYLRATVERLQEMHQQLVQQQQQQHHHHHHSGEGAMASSGVLTALEAARGDLDRVQYVDLLATSSQLKEERFHLQQQLDQKQKFNEMLERFVADTAQLHHSVHEDESSVTSTGPSSALTQVRAASVPGDGVEYTPITPTALQRHIAQSRSELDRIQKVLQPSATASSSAPAVAVSTPSPSPSPSPLSPCSSPSSSPPSSCSSSPSPSLSTPLPPFFDWTLRHHIRDSLLLFSFEKTFLRTSARSAMERMWTNERRLVSYRDPTVQQALAIVQEFPDSGGHDRFYVMQRRLLLRERWVRSTYLRFRLRTPHGFLVATTSVNPQQAQEQQLQLPAAQQDDGNVWAAKLRVWTEFFDGQDDANGGDSPASNSGCSVRVTGSINLDTSGNVHQQLAQLVVGLLRWENDTMGARFTLTAD